MAMEFGDYKDHILLGLGTLLIGWLTFLTVTVMNCVSRADVEKMIEYSRNHSIYTEDKPLINSKIDQLDINYGKILNQLDRFGASINEMHILVERVSLIQQMQSPFIKPPGESPTLKQPR